MVDAGWLIGADPVRQALAALLVVVPAVFILFSRRCGLLGKPVWILLSQAPWAFILGYVWLWRTRYDEAAAALPPLDEALGWWVLAYPWGVYLLYRATRRRFPGERSADD